MFLVCHPQSIGEIMRKLGSPSPRFSSLIMLGFLLHKLNLSDGALERMERFNGRSNSELCLFGKRHWRSWTFGWRTAAKRIQQHLEVRFCYRALVLPSLATLIHCGSLICLRSARRRHFCSWLGSRFRIGRTLWDHAGMAPCTWPLKSTERWKKAFKWAQHTGSQLFFWLTRLPYSNPSIENATYKDSTESGLHYISKIKSWGSSSV